MHHGADTNPLSPTHYCDHDHPAIRERARILAREAPAADQVAAHTFRWVRDRLPFGLDLVKVKASETLQKGYGARYNKSLLLTTLLRAGGIPARFCSVPVSRWFMRPYIGRQCLLVSHPFHHCLVQVGLEGGWSWAEPALDRATYEALFRPLGVDWGIDWRPERPELLYRESLMGEPRVHEDIDRAIGRNVGNTMPPALLARALCGNANRKAWARIGIKPLELDPA